VQRFASYPKNKKDMFDIALAGPLVGTLLSIGLFAAGAEEGQLPCDSECIFLASSRFTWIALAYQWSDA
jgi:hypothetical protein